MANENRLIYADALRTQFDDIPPYIGMTGGCVQKYIDEAPTVDAVEVVRCKDCKNDGRCSIQDAMNWTPRAETGDYFCSYGERRTDG